MGDQRSIQDTNGEAQTYHVPVLLNEVLEGLEIKPDGTLRRLHIRRRRPFKGHPRQARRAGRLFVFDQDEDARRNLPDDKRVVFVPHNFRHLQRFLRLHDVEGVDGILADLGVSSHQFDEASRGFSIRFDAPLDMRMDARQSLKAADIIRTYSEAELHKLFERYGEVTNAKTLARSIVAQRNVRQIDTISQFREAVKMKSKETLINTLPRFSRRCAWK